MSITRRRLFAVSGTGGAAAILAACGAAEDQASPERDVELLNTALAAEATVASMYAALPAGSGPGGEALDVFGQQASAQVERLKKAIEDAGGTPEETKGQAPTAESAVEALTLALNNAIAAYHDAVGDLSTPPLRRTVYELVAADAAQLAALRGLLGSEQAPEAFVTGGDEPPLEAEGEQ
jgi:hypothetical protein